MYNPAASAAASAQTQSQQTEEQMTDQSVNTYRFVILRFITFIHVLLSTRVHYMIGINGPSALSIS